MVAEELESEFCLLRTNCESANNPHQALARPPKIGTEKYLNIARLQEGKLIAFDLLLANHELKIHHKLMTLDVEIV